MPKISADFVFCILPSLVNCTQYLIVPRVTDDIGDSCDRMKAVQDYAEWILTDSQVRTLATAAQWAQMPQKISKAARQIVLSMTCQARQDSSSGFMSANWGTNEMTVSKLEMTLPPRPLLQQRQLANPAGPRHRSGGNSGLRIHDATVPTADAVQRLLLAGLALYGNPLQHEAHACNQRRRCHSHL